MEEKVFFECGDTRVTNARFVLAGKTFAMNGVTSVRQSMAPASIKGPLIAIAVGLLILIAASGSGKLIGVVVAGLGVWMLISQKSTHYVFLSSASGEQQALESKDQSYIDGVVSALNDALIHRG